MPSSPRTASDAAELERSRLQFEKMTKTPVPKLILGLAAPTILSMLITSIYNLADTFFVGRLSTSASGAVGVVSSLMAIIQALGFMLGHGAGGIISRSLGSQDTHAATKFASTSFFTALTFGAVLAVLGLATLPDFMMLLGSTDTILPHACAYARPILIAAPLMMSSLVMNNILRYEGKASFAMIGLVAGGVLNILLDPIFIFGYCGEALSGTTGAAVATVIGQFCGAGMTLYFNTRKNPDIQLDFKGFRPSAKAIGRIYTVGLPSIAMQCVGSLMTFGMNLILMAFSSTAVAVFGVYFKLQSFVFMPIFGLNNGMVPIISYNYGARRPERVKKTIRLAVCYAEGIMVLGFCIFEFFPGQVLGLFSASQAMLTIGIPAMRIICLHFLLAGTSIVLSSVFQALGNGLFSLIVSVCRQLFVLLPAAWLLAQTGNVNNVWWAFLIAEIVSVLMSLAFYAHINKTIIVPLCGPVEP